MAASKPKVLPAVAGLCFAAGSLLLFSHDFGSSPETAATVTVAVTPPPQTTAADPETTGALPPAAQQGDSSISQLADGGKILVSKQTIAVLAGPSPTAATMYGFPAGRPFRVIGREAGFVQIRDVKSGASGWIEETALVPAPRAPSVAAAAPATQHAKAKTAPTKVTNKPAKPRTPAAVETETAAAEPAPKRRRGLFSGLFRNNRNDVGLGFNGGAYGTR